jgi:AhpD family alkylhydroperoxidase
MDYAEISKETIGFLYKSRASLSSSPLSPAMRVLAELRTSQINRCAYRCLLHTEEARKVGIAQEKLDTLPAWQHASSFTEEEKLVLQWVEAVTRLDKELEKVKERLLQIYSERQIVDLTAYIAIMNALNRIVIGVRE